jgi:tubby-related protein 1
VVAHPRGLRTQLVQCTIVRDRSSIHGKLYPSYELILEEPKKTLIIARKMSMNRTSNYHLFDMTRGAASNKLSKKAGNYLGKLRSKNMNRTGYSLLNQKEEKEEIAGVLFDRITFMDQINEGNQPRKMKILIPLLDEENIPVPMLTQSTYGFESLPDLLQMFDEKKLALLPKDLRLLQTKEPTFENGNYRLNFHGRVSMPSVKNFQIVSIEDKDEVICQFGKVDKDTFHLDYKEPLNAVQAFALALCQFNL